MQLNTILISAKDKIIGDFTLMNAALLALKPLSRRFPALFLKGSMAAATLALAAPAVHAQKWPDSPITFIVPFSPGGGGDTMVRLYATQLSKTMNHNFIVDNRPGAGGNIGTVAAARAKPDGNTIVFGTAGTMGTNHALYKNPGFKVTDFDPIALFGTTALTMVVSPDSPFKTPKDLVDYAKANPGKLTCASGGNGTISHLACAALQQQAKVEINHIPYKGTSTAQIDIRSGRISFMIDVTPPLTPQINSGALRPLAVTSAKRVESMPNVPTLAETVLPGYEIFTWDGIFAPKGTPAERLDILHAAVQKAFEDPEFKKTMSDRGINLQPMPRKEFGELVMREHDRMGDLARSLGVTID